MNEDLVQEIRRTGFSVVSLREGYVVAEVDAFLDDLCSALTRGDDVVQRIIRARFTPSRRNGYEMGEVDRLLDLVIDRVEPGVDRLPGGVPSDPRVDYIREAEFMPVRRGGYDMTDVDAFLDDVCQRLLRDEPVRLLVAGASFSKIRLGAGYEQSQVDSLLAEIDRRAAEHGEASAPGRLPELGVVQESRGLLSRILRRDQ